MKKTLTIILLLLLTLTTHATLFNGNTNPTADCFVPAQESFALLNDSSLQQTYTISSTGPQKDWVNLEGKWIARDPVSVTLAPNQSKDVFAFLKPQDCYVNPGTYPITIHGNNGNAFSQVINLKVVPIRTLVLNMDTPTASVDQCGETVYPITIENTGESDELVSLKVEGIPVEWASFSAREFVLDKGRTRELELRVNPTCNAVTGKHDFIVQAFLAHTSFFTKQDVSLTITQTESVEFVGLAQQQLKACNDEQSSHTLTIRNNGSQDDIIQVRVDGPDWVSLGVDAVGLDAGEEKTIGLQFASSEAEAANYLFTLKTHSEKFNQSYDFPLSVDLQDCYGSSTGSITINGTGYTPGMDVCVEDPVLIETTVTNPQTKPITLSVELEGASGTSNPATLTLAPGAVQPVNITASFAGEIEGEKEFSVNFNSAQFNGTQSFMVNTVNCYALEVDYRELAGQIDVNAEGQEVFTVYLKNVGSKGLNVETNVSGPAYVYFQPHTRFLQPGQEEGVFLYISPPFDTPEGKQTVTVTVNARGFEDTKEVAFNVFGGLYALIGEARLLTNGEITGQSEVSERTINMSVRLTNDGNSLIRISGVTAEGYAVGVNFTETTLEPQESTEFPISIQLEKGDSRKQFVVPLTFQTDKGPIVKSIGVDLTQKGRTPPIGFFTLGDTRDSAIILLALVIVVLIAVIALRSRGNDGNTGEEEQYFEEPSQKPNTMNKSNVDMVAEQKKKAPVKKGKKK